MKAFQEVKHYLTDFKVWHNIHTNIGILAHWHDEIELIYMQDGEASFTISNKAIIAKKGDLIFCDKREIHYTTSHNENTTFEFLIFDSGIISNYYQGLFLSSHLLTSQEMKDMELSEEWQILTKVCDKELKEEGSFYKDIISSQIKGFFFRMARAIQQKNNDRVYEDRKYRMSIEFSKVLSYIGEHYSEKLTLPDLASLLGFSEGHFSKLFKKSTGLGFAKYLNYIRISNAMEMIRGGEHRMVDISSSCGFESVRNFNRVFLNVAGCTPTEYAADNQNANISFISTYRSVERLESYTMDNPTIA